MTTTILGFATSNTSLTGSAGADLVYGNTTGTVNFVAGHDGIFALAGDDVVTGDGAAIAAGGRGGNDRIEGGAGNDIIYGDAVGDVWGVAGNDTLYGDTATTVGGNDTIYGDAGGTLHGVGGNDVIYQNGGAGVLLGDATRIAAGGDGGDDMIYGGSLVGGDSAGPMVDATGGDDLIVATDATGSCRLFGETLDEDLAGASVGGRDHIVGGAYADAIYGEGVMLSGTTKGGADWLSGGGGNDTVYGDGSCVRDAASGGNDVVWGGDGNDTLYGDGLQLLGTARGGDDDLYAGSGKDVLWGDGLLFSQADGGRDRFHFEGDFGADRVMDFRKADGDQLVFDGVTQNGTTISHDGANTVLSFAGGQSVTLVDFTDALAVGTDLLFT